MDSLRVGCVLITPVGHARVVEIGNRDFRVRLLSTGQEKRYLLSYLHRFGLFSDVDRSGPWGKMFERLSQERPYPSERCDRPLTDLVSIAIGRGPCCRSKVVAIQRRRFYAEVRASIESGDHTNTVPMDDEEEARLLIEWYCLNA